MSRSPLKVNQCLGGTRSLCLQSSEVMQKISMKQLCLMPTSYGFHTAWPTLQPWTWRQHVSPNYRLTSNGLHSIASRKTELIKQHALLTHTYLPLLSAIKKALTFVKFILRMQDSKHFTTSTLLVASAPVTATALSWEDTRLLCTASLNSDIHLQQQSITTTHYGKHDYTLSHKQGSLLPAHHSTGYWQFSFS